MTNAAIVLTHTTDTAPKLTVIPANPALTAPGRGAARRLRVAAYARVSTDQEEQESSFEAQKNYYTDLIMSNKEWTMAGIYADEGITGTQLKKRKDFNRMLRDCKNGKIDMVLTKSTSRFARNTVDSIQTIRELKALGIPVIFEKEGIDTGKMDSETIIALHSVLAQSESESISGNVKWGFRRAFEAGKVFYSYGHWYGYKKGEDGRPEIIPEQAEVVRGIYADFLAGHSYKQIADALNGKSLLREMTVRRKKGVREKKLVEWTCGIIQSMLKNERYCGDAISQKTYIQDCISKKPIVNNGEVPKFYLQNAHDAIIDRATWHRVQREIARRAAKRSPATGLEALGASKYSGKFALTELLVCGECGATYRRRTWKRKNGEKLAVWRCGSRVAYGAKYCTGSPSIEESRLHEALTRAMLRYLSSRGQLLKTLKDSFEIALAAQQGRESLAGLKHQKAELEKTIFNLTETLMDAPDSSAYYEQFRTLREQSAALASRIEELNGKQEEQGAVTGQIAGVQQVLETAPLELQEYDDGLVRLLLEAVRVVDEDSVRVCFRDGCEVVEQL